MPIPAARSLNTGIEQNCKKKRITVISDGQSRSSLPDYAIDNCKQHNAEIDLLLHNGFDVAKTCAIEKQIRETGINFQRIELDESTHEDFTNTSMIYLVGIAYDPFVKILLKKSFQAAHTACSSSNFD